MVTVQSGAKKGRAFVSPASLQEKWKAPAAMGTLVHPQVLKKPETLLSNYWESLSVLADTGLSWSAGQRCNARPLGQRVATVRPLGVCRLAEEISVVRWSRVDGQPDGIGTGENIDAHSQREGQR
tara:strand:- start:176 stop:550 length:375 start_codon:yes stop_codon:yes gene_type:complete